MVTKKASRLLLMVFLYSLCWYLTEQIVLWISAGTDSKYVLAFGSAWWSCLFFAFILKFDITLFVTAMLAYCFLDLLALFFGVEIFAHMRIRHDIFVESMTLQEILRYIIPRSLLFSCPIVLSVLIAKLQNVWYRSHKLPNSQREQRI